MNIVRIIVLKVHMSNAGARIACVFVMTDLNRQILHGDVIEKLNEIPDDTIDCIITSPPYWGLRDYSVKGQLGLEPDFKDYLKIMKKIMAECKRVLKPTGSCWINLGDTYSSSGGDPKIGQSGLHGDACKCHSCLAMIQKKRLRMNNTQTKSRIGIPERFYIQCIDDGWIARNHIPWIKNNTMPSSVKDRFANKWESIFFFVKSQKYYFNLDAVREKTLTESKPFNVRVRDTKKGYGQAKLTGGMSKKEDEDYNSKGELKEKLNDRKHVDSTETLKRDHSGNYDSEGNGLNNPKGKNPGDVFYINTRPFPEAHFATFPIDLPLKILKCAMPPDGIVLDPFFGAGTTGVAAEKLGLQWAGIELNETYIKIAEKRLTPFLNTKLENL